MELVVDANIIFSALIKNSYTANLILNEELKLYTAEFVIEELLKYEGLILHKTSRSPEQFADIMDALRQRITIVPQEEYARFMDEAKMISPDEKDVAYVALALRLRCAIWSNDKALKGQASVMVYSTSEVRQILT